MAHRRFKDFHLDEISAVDRPAQKGAKAVIMKRDNGDADKVLKGKIAAGMAMPDGTFLIEKRDDLTDAIRKYDATKHPAAVKSHIVARARALDGTSLLPTDWGIGKSIGGDLVMELARVAPRALPELLDNVVKAEEIEAQLAKLGDAKIRKGKLHEIAVAKSALIASAWSVVDGASGADAMSLLQKNFGDYKDHVLGLVPTADGGTKVAKGDGDMKAIAKALGLPETATEAEITAAVIKLAGGEIATLKSDLAKANAIAGLSVAHRAFFDKADEAGKTAFLALAVDKRDAAIKAAGGKTQAEMDAEAKKPVGDDDCIKVDGKPIYKRDVGDATFTILKSQQDRLEKADDERDTAVIAKRIAPMKFVIGKAEDTAAILHRVTKGTATKADADAIETMLKAANDQMAKSSVITKEFGQVTGVGFNKAADAIMAKAMELQKANTKWSIEKAKTEARRLNPDLEKQEAEEAREARRAA